MQISKKSQYGLRAMIYLAKTDKVASLKSISQSEGISFDFLEKILSKLEKAKLVESKKGAGGGYYLSKPSKKITAGDIVNALDKIKAVDCALCGKARKCASKNVWDRIDVAVNKTLKSITLKDLI